MSSVNLGNLVQSATTLRLVHPLHQIFNRMLKTRPPDNLTAVLYGTEDLRMEQRPVPRIKNTDVLLQIDCVGICGSDIHYLAHGKIGPFVVKKPMIIGHEASGVVVEAGERVQNLKKYDRVAVEPGVPCRYCDFCRRGLYNLCPKIAFCATPPYDGSLTRYFAHPADFCYKLPDHVSMEEGALLEPLSVGVHACNRAGITLGSDCLILGAGPMGLVTLLVAQSMGATNIAIADLKLDRLKMAESLGAHHTILIGPTSTEEELIPEIHERMGMEPNKTIDCSDAGSAARLAISATQSGGVVVIVGMPPDRSKIPLNHSVVREVDIRGVFRYCNNYPTALALASSGKVDLKRLITHHFDLTETIKAFQKIRQRKNGPIKVMIHCNPRNAFNFKPF